jgi:hypothetical protein
MFLDTQENVHEMKTLLCVHCMLTASVWMILATTLATWIIQMIMNRVESNAVYSLILQVNIADTLQRRKSYTGWL